MVATWQNYRILEKMVKALNVILLRLGVIDLR